MTFDFAWANRSNHQHDLFDAARGLFDHVGDSLGIGDIDSVGARHLNNGGAGPFRDKLLGGIRNHFVVAQLGDTNLVSTSKPALFTLDLSGSAVVIGGAGKYHQVSTWAGLATHQLADGSDRINDGCARGVGYEALQWFENATARRLTRKRKQVWLSWLETSDRSL